MAVMAGRAERLQRDVPEQLGIATVRPDVIGDGGRRDPTHFPAHPAQRLVLELRRTTVAPPGELVPADVLGGAFGTLT